MINNSIIFLTLQKLMDNYPKKIEVLLYLLTLDFQYYSKDLEILNDIMALMKLKNLSISVWQNQWIQLLKHYIFQGNNSQWVGKIIYKNQWDDNKYSILKNDHVMITLNNNTIEFIYINDLDGGYIEYQDGYVIDNNNKIRWNNFKKFVRDKKLR